MRKGLPLPFRVNPSVLIAAIAVSFLISGCTSDKAGAREKEQSVQELVMQAVKAYRDGLQKLDAGDRTEADKHLEQAYRCYEEAHDLYEKLVEQNPSDDGYLKALREMEQVLYEVQKSSDPG